MSTTICFQTCRASQWLSKIDDIQASKILKDLRKWCVPLNATILLSWPGEQQAEDREEQYEEE
jgi:hypothetical protein